MNNAYIQTISTNSSTGYTLDLPAGAKPAPAPKGLLATRAVETKDGWVGQVIVDTEILYESKLYPGEDGSADALEHVNARVVERIKKLFR